VAFGKKETKTHQNAAFLEVHAHASGKPRHDNFHAASCWRGRLDRVRRPGSLYDDFVRLQIIFHL